MKGEGWKDEARELTIESVDGVCLRRRDEFAPYSSPFALHSSLFIHPCTAALVFALALAGCASHPPRQSAPPATSVPEQGSVPSRPPASQPRGGGYYLDDGPGDNPPANLDQIPDAIPRMEALARGAMRPYSIMGRNYTPMTSLQPYKARGVASWYGRRYHGKQTSSGEIYDMYGMTAAHTTLPLPSYAKVTNLQNNRSVVVRVNDRGPFHSDRLIDLSYTAAHRLGLLSGGSGMVEVESIIPGAFAPPASVAAFAPPRPVVEVSAIEIPASPVATPIPAETTSAKPVVAVSSEARGFFLQLGAFGSSENAENYLNRLRAQVDWIAPVLHVFSRDGLFRVHAGPYPSQEQARQNADRIGQSLGIKPVVISR